MAFAFVCYAIIWLGVTLYVFNIAQQHKKLASQVEALEAAVTSGAARAAADQGARRA